MPNKQVGDIVLPKDTPADKQAAESRRLMAASLNTDARRRQAASMAQRATSAPPADSPADDAVRRINDANPLRQAVRRLSGGRLNYSGRSSGRSSGR